MRKKQNGKSYEMPQKHQIIVIFGPVAKFNFICYCQGPEQAPASCQLRWLRSADGHPAQRRPVMK